MINLRHLLLTCSLIPNLLFAQDVSGQETAIPNANRELIEALPSELIIRVGQGGFDDERPPDGSLGGGQIAFDLAAARLPVVISLSTEYYSNSSEPSFEYEIDSLVSLNILYSTTFMANDRLRVFAGGGLGRLKLPRSERFPDEKIHAELYNLELGLDFRLTDRFGLYAVTKHFNAQRRIDGEQVVNFDEQVVLLGVSFRFQW